MCPIVVALQTTLTKVQTMGIHLFTQISICTMLGVQLGNVSSINECLCYLRNMLTLEKLLLEAHCNM